jgi:hypothetical protein
MLVLQGKLTNSRKRQKGGGTFGIDMLIDFTNALLQGKIEVKGGNMKSLLALAEQYYDIAGDLDGSIIVNKEGKGTVSA